MHLCLTPASAQTMHASCAGAGEVQVARVMFAV